MLLSGSVIGGVSDLGLVYYNPARLSQVANPAFLISADVYELNRIQINDAFGRDADAKQQDFGGVPSMAAGTFSIPFLKKHHFGWAILIRHNYTLSPGYKKEVYDNVIDYFPGNEYFGADVHMNIKIKEEWTGVTWSYPVNERISIGASGYYTHSDIGKGSKIDLQAMSDDKQVAVYRFAKDYSGSVDGLLFKAGISWQQEKFIAGLTLTTPVLVLRSGSGYRHELYFSSIADYIENDEVYLSNSQKDLPTKYRTPLSLGGGITYHIGKSNVHFSTEWFSRVNRYSLFSANEYYSQSHGDTLNFKLMNELRSILNAGIGIEYFLSEKISAHGSFSTDFSALAESNYSFFEQNAESTAGGFRSDYYHLGGGFVLTLKGAEITLGCTYTGAGLQIPRIFDFPEEGDDEIFEADEYTTLQWQRWRFVFSFSMPCLKDVEARVEERLGF